MIRIEEGSAGMLPWVVADVEPGRWPFEWWWEVRCYDKSIQGWVALYKMDDGRFGLWRAMRAAREAVTEAWGELVEAEHEAA